MHNINLDHKQNHHSSPEPSDFLPSFTTKSFSITANMATVSIYDATIPTFTKGLKTFQHILTKAEEHAKANGVDVNTYAEARIIEDQLPLTFQVQNATKTVKTNIGRLTGVELEPFENKEKTFADLHARIKETLDLLSKVDAATVNAKASSEVEL